MSLSSQIRNNSRLDQRRQSKSVICRIIYGQGAINFLYRYSLIPGELILNYDTGYSSINNYLCAIPVTEWLSYKKLSSMVNVGGQIGTPTTTKVDQEDRDRAAEDTRALISFLKQNMVLISIPVDRIPGGNWAGANPEAYDVSIDTIDVSSGLDGFYIIRNPGRIRDKKDWDK